MFRDIPPGSDARRTIDALSQRLKTKLFQPIAAATRATERGVRTARKDLLLASLLPVVIARRKAYLRDRDRFLEMEQVTREERPRSKEAHQEQALRDAMENAWKILFQRAYSQWNRWLHHLGGDVADVPMESLTHALQPPHDPSVESGSLDSIHAWRSHAARVGRELRRLHHDFEMGGGREGGEMGTSAQQLIDAMEESLRNHTGGDALDADTTAWLRAGRATLLARETGDREARQRRFYAARVGLARLVAWWTAAVEEVSTISDRGMARLEQISAGRVDPSDLAAFLRSRADASWLAFRDSALDQLSAIKASLVRQADKEAGRVQDIVEREWSWGPVEEDLMKIEYSLRTYCNGSGYEDMLLWIKTYAAGMVRAVQTAQAVLLHDELQKLAAAWAEVEQNLGAA